MGKKIPKRLISVIVSVYNVESYLPDFLESLDRQTIDLNSLEIIFVDDGSTDGSRSLIDSWIAGSGTRARAVTQTNGGLSAARNTGLGLTSNKWVTFPDPDDVLDPKYFESVANFLQSPGARKTHLIATQLLILNDSTGELTNSHPLRKRFTASTRVIDLERHPEYIHLSAATGFYRRNRIEKLDLSFDSRIRPNFEDAHFTALYLYEEARPRVAFLGDAQYQYRKRADGSSLVQSSWRKREKYTDLLRYGYLALLETVSERKGWIPLWVQNYVLYDIFYYFQEDNRIHSGTASVSRDVSLEFFRLLENIVEYLDADAIADFRLVATKWEYRQALLMRYKRINSRPSHLSVDRLDTNQEIARIKYYYSGDLPVEEYRARGYVVEPIHKRIRTHTLLGEVLMRERTVWLPATGTIGASLDGNRLPVVPQGITDVPFNLKPRRLWSTMSSQPLPVEGLTSGGLDPVVQPVEATPGSGLRMLCNHVRRYVGGDVKAPEQTVTNTRDFRGLALRAMTALTERTGLLPQRTLERLLPDSADQFTANHVEAALRLARSKLVQARYKNAWVLIDRDSEAHDNAEHLYRYLLGNRPEINTWFVLSRRSHDWERLAEEGFRLIAHGSLEHILLLLNCEHLISSQVDHYIVHPLEQKLFGKPAWRFTFLQHGVTKDDVSRWLNPKPIDLLITSTSPEYESLVKDETEYVFSTKEVKLTGMPRHDSLLEKSLSVPKQGRKFILVMPTWRRSLLGDAIVGGNQRAQLDSFWNSEYAQEWRGLLESERLASLAKRAGLSIAFMPHPNMQAYLDEFEVPAWVEIYRYSNTNVQSMLAQGAVMITDYSSLAFDSAYIGQPVIYFQFDKASFFSGSHVFRAGEWDYEKDGFGPVTSCREDTLEALEQVLVNDLEPDEIYRRRMQEIFPFRDGRCSERVADAILRLNSPLKYEEAYKRVSSRLKGAGAVAAPHITAAPESMEESPIEFERATAPFIL